MKFNLVITIFILCGLVTSCTKYVDPAPYSSNLNEDSLNIIKTRKVLLINIDGLGGATLNSTAPTNIFKLLDHSKYNFSTYQGDTLTEPAAWQTLMTGVGYYVHQIGDSSWIVPPGEDFENARPYYASFIERLLAAKPRSKTYAVSPWSNLVNSAGFLYANQYKITSSDTETSDSLNSQLKTSSSDLFVSEFNSYVQEGMKTGFKGSTAIAQLNKIDEYIGTFVSTIKARDSYSNEEWLIIINSQFGGDGVTNSENGFRIMYNDRLTRQEVKTIGYNSPTFASNNLDRTGILIDSSYNFGSIGEYTMSINILATATSSYPSLISKNSSLAGAGGWTLFGSASHKSFEARFYSTNGASMIFRSSNPLTDGAWHNVTFVITGTGANRVIRFYFDGAIDNSNPAFQQPIAMANFVLNNNIPITLGAWFGNTSSGAATSNFNNIKIYNKALSATEVADQAVQVDVENDPNYNSIIGFWTCNDGHSLQMRNSIPNRPSFILGSALSWASVNPVPLGFTSVAGSTTQFSIDPDNTDIAPNIFKWLRANINSSWGWSKPWINNFEYEYGIE